MTNKFLLHLENAHAISVSCTDASNHKLEWLVGSHKPKCKREGAKQSQVDCKQAQSSGNSFVPPHFPSICQVFPIPVEMIPSNSL